MVDSEVLKSRIETIQEMLTILHRFQKLSADEFANNREAQLAVEHALFIAIQSLLDLGGHILADKEIRNIADYRDVILKLAQAKVIPPFFAESIADMAGFRNRLIHEYQDIDPRKVHEFLEHRLSDFEEFMKYIRDYFRLG